MDGGTDTDGAATEPGPAGEPDRVPPLRAVVVRYESGPDRCTLVPDRSAESLLSAWLTADLDAFVDLESLR